LDFYKDKENRFLRVNEAFRKVMGLPKEQLEGKTCGIFIQKIRPMPIGKMIWRS